MRDLENPLQVNYVQITLIIQQVLTNRVRTYYYVGAYLFLSHLQHNIAEVRQRWAFVGEDFMERFGEEVDSLFIAARIIANFVASQQAVVTGLS